jgi:hypothetical protein
MQQRRAKPPALRTKELPHVSEKEKNHNEKAVGSTHQKLRRACARWMVRARQRNHVAFLLFLGVMVHSLWRVATPLARQGAVAGGDEPEGVAACLLIMDDNHFLVEWMAYHYHAAGLRKLVVAIDPKSTTSPLEILSRWRDKIDITVWKSDDDYITRKEFLAEYQRVTLFFSVTSPSLVEHRARQRVFYTQCLRKIKNDSDNRDNKAAAAVPSQSRSAWTMLVDVDEFVKVHYDVANEWGNKVPRSAFGGGNHTAVLPIDQPGSVVAVLKTLEAPSGDNGTAVTETTPQPPWARLRSSPCIPLPRLRFISREDDDAAEQSRAFAGNESFLTQTYRARTRGDDMKRNKISKVIIDLGRVALDDIKQVDSIHMPIRKYCKQSNRYFFPKDSLLVVNHYLGSYEQFTDRTNDARNEVTETMSVKTVVNVRNEQRFNDEQKMNYEPEIDSEIQPWLKGFLEAHPGGAAETFLSGSGKLAPKSWRPVFHNGDRCALLFFGLTRSYKDMVLPSLIENVLKPNVRHGCDVYAHFYKQETEETGRNNEGGDLNPDDIFLLEEAVHSVAREYYETVLLQHDYQVLPGNSRPRYESPVVAFTHDTPLEFSERRSEQLKRYLNETIEHNGKQVYAYIPWAKKNKNFMNESLTNVVKQWHSIQSAFQLMDYTSKLQNISYSRVGMFRSDCLYVTPIDIASLGGSSNVSSSTQTGGEVASMAAEGQLPRYDVGNQFFVTPGFALWPVNDRLVYGPYDAVKIWATKRFDLVEESAKSQNNPGYTMHSERFLNTTVFPAMEGLGFGHVSNGFICFLRTRAVGGNELIRNTSAKISGKAFLNDCSGDGLLPTPLTIDTWNSIGFTQQEQLMLEGPRMGIVERIVGTRCGTQRNNRNPRKTMIRCSNQWNYSVAINPSSQ